jgi:nucleotide sugar dehydrogenase
MPPGACASPPTPRGRDRHGDVVFIAVGTPPDEDGSADLQYVLAVAAPSAAPAQAAVVVDKSTVPVGTADKVRAAIAAELAARGASVAFDVVSNPEFLKEGAAVEDCMRPDRIVIGTDSPAAERRCAPVRAVQPQPRPHRGDGRAFAELTKYAANAMLATKISFMNEIANIAEQVGADVEMVRKGIGSDPRIGWHFIYPGAGYGGSCFPKDVQALARTAQQHGVQPRLLEAVEAVNEAQKGHLFELMVRHYGEDEGVRGKTVAVWGLAFKPNTDDMREASSRACCSSCGTPARACAPTIRRRWTRPGASSASATTWCCATPAPTRCRAPTRWSWSPNGSSSAARISRAAGGAGATRWCSMAATCTSRPRSKPPAWRITASGAGARCARPR